ncbi:MAG: type I methionyl aminopeptidase [Alphaproteobacteria bacterium]|nr:type I methionyl aminopeptidase [Alphaproteobacteria bacterium]
MKDVQKRSRDGIPLHDASAFASMRAAGKLAAETLDYITPFVKTGVTTEELDRLCHDFITKHGAIPAPLGYKGYPKSICTSINEVVCHGIPEKRELKDGDIVNIDVTVILDGWYGDTSRMYWAGEPSIKARRLTDITYRSMMAGIEAVKPGATLGCIGHAIQTLAEAEHCSVVRDFCGHGLGRVFHDTPSVLHYGEPHTGAVLEPGMLFTIEPMINLGDWRTKVKSDGWTAVTKDRSLSAQFEHTIGVTETGYEIFTLSPKNLHFPPYA